MFSANFDHHVREKRFFVTFRTNDSILREVLCHWHREKVQRLETRGIRYQGDFEAAIAQLSTADANAFRKTFNRQREVGLDQCRSECVL